MDEHTPPTWLVGPTTSDEAATGRRAAKAARKAAPPLAANVIAQCDRCGATDDAEVRLRRPAHSDCGGTFRFFGHTGTEKPPHNAPPPRLGTEAGDKVEQGSYDTPNNTAHNPDRCTTCRGGIRPWTHERREELRSIACRSRRLWEVAS